MKILNWLLAPGKRPRKSRSASPARHRFALETIEQRVLLSVAPVISEVHSGGSGNGTYAADWIEVTNLDTADLDITGWKMDDNSNAAASAVPLRGVSIIPAGKSAIFFEGNASGTTDSAIIAAFSTAWFGSTTPPSGFLIGAYGGTGVGLSTGGDAVNLFDAAGNRVTGVSFGAAAVNTTFDNAAGLGSTTLPLPTVSNVSLAGIRGAFLSANGLETGSPGNKGVTSVDLSLYVRVGRFDLPEPTRTTAPANSVLAQEVSAVTYNWNTDTLFVVGDGGTSIVQVTRTGQLIDSMTLAPGSSPQGTDFYDPEGLTYIGNGKFVMTEERDRQAVLFSYAPGTTLTRSLAQTVKFGTFVDNTGAEGLSYDPQTGGFIILKETQPEGIFQTNFDFNAGTATNGSPTTVNSVDLFDPALLNLLDLADVYALSNLPSLMGIQSSHLLVLSQESGKILNVDRSGTIFSSLTIVSDPGNPLSVANQQHEGMTMDWNGFLYVVSENGGGDINHPQLWVYAPSAVANQAPTAIALVNQVNSILENTSTAAPIKVADITISDDGLGTNNFSLSGADAAFFEINGNALYIKAGTTLDFETKTSYSVNVSVDDTTLGNTPDATASFVLTVADVVSETPTVAPLIISEVSPWSSGNTPYAADWFEVTNTGTTDVNITGWKVDDSSNLFANALALRGVNVIPAGKSAVFFESDPSGVTDAAILAAFSNAWFGTTTPPAGILIGAYGGSGVGLSTSGDAVNLFDAAGTRIAGVTFGASTTGATFDNTAGLAAVTALSTAGVRGAFIAADGIETGSPGTIIHNDAPIAAADTLTTTEDTAVTFNVLGNDTDANGDGVKILVYTLTGHGTLTLSCSGNFTYTPAANFNGSDSFTYVISDGKGGGTATGTVSVTVSAVNDAPVAGNESFTTNEDVPLTIVGAGVLTNDADAENSALSAILVTGPSHGTIVLNAGGSFTYTPVANFSGTDSFTYRANDGTTTSNVATVTITVNGVNDAPVAKNDRYSTDKKTTLSVLGTGVLKNDSDPDSSTLTAVLVSGVSHGKLKLNMNGSFTYTPDKNFKGKDSFTYRISDGTSTSNLATVTITVGEDHHCHDRCECGRHRHHNKYEKHNKHGR